MSIRKKFIVLLVCLITLVTTTVATIRARQIHLQTSALISERLYGNANLAVGIFGTVKIFTERMLNVIAALPLVQDVLANADNSYVNLEEYLAAFLTSMNQIEYGAEAYANIFVFDADFRLIATANPEGDTVDLTYGMFPYNIREAMLGMPLVSPVAENPKSGLWQFLFTEPVMINGRFSGIAAILSNTEVLDFFLREPTHDYDSFINIADSTGRIFFSNRPAYVGRHLDDLGVYEAFGYTPLNRIFSHNSAITGIDKIAYITTEPLLGWTVVSFFDADAVENIAWAIFMSLLPTVSGVILAAIFLILIVNRSLKPLKVLAATANDVAKGNLAVEFDTSGKDEISQVSLSFLEIVTALEILQENFKKAESAMTSLDTVYMLEDSRLGGIFDAMFTMTNNVIKHIQRSKLEAENASKAKSDFLSKMSHEIRTPMNAILGMSELILREDISGTAREQAMTIKQSGGHLLSIINNILDISKVESGKLEIINAEYFFHSTIHDVISIIKMRMTNPKLNFAVYMQHDIPNELVGDEVRIRQGLLNILSNALKYTKNGFFSLDVTSQWTNADTIMLTIKVKDTGIGIKKQDMEKIFNDFSQFDLEKNRNIEGTGLGLAITKSLVNLMRGWIQASSTYGEGSEFIVHLPQKVSEKNTWLHVKTDCDALDARVKGKHVLLYGRTPIYTEYTIRALNDLGVSYHTINDESSLLNKLLEKKWSHVFAEEELAATAMHIVYTRELDTKVVLMTDSYVARGGQDFLILIMPAYYISIVNVLCGEDSIQYAKNQQMEYFVAPEAKVLLVDDIETNLKVCEGLLKSYGISVTTCLSGMEAIEAVAAEDYDMVLMDQMMPEMDGVEAVRHIRALAGGKYADLPIIALTANAIIGAREMFLENGFNDFLSKPIETAKLNSIMAAWIPKEKQKRVLPSLEGMAEEKASISIRIEGIDTAKGLLFSGGSAQSYIDILKVFHRDGTKKIDELANCLKNNYLSLYTTHIHALKSACANIGATKLHEEAKILEAAGIKHDMDFIKKHNDSFTNGLKKLLANIFLIINEVTSAAAEKLDDKTLDTGVLKAQLFKLKTALDNFDVVSIDEASLMLQDFTVLSGTGEILSDILENTFVGRYKQAAALIEEIVASLD